MKLPKLTETQEELLLRAIRNADGVVIPFGVGEFRTAYSLIDKKLIEQTSGYGRRAYKISIIGRRVMGQGK